MSHADFIIFTYVLFTPRLFVWVKYGFWSLDFFISVLLSLLPPTLDAILASHKYDHHLVILGWFPGLLHGYYVARKPYQWPVMSRGFLAFLTIFMILFFPYMAIFTRFGFWSLHFATNSILWYLAHFCLLYFHHDYFTLGLMGLLPCMLHAYYILVKYPSRFPDTDQIFQARTVELKLEGDASIIRAVPQDEEAGMGPPKIISGKARKGDVKDEVKGRVLE
jgi:uncharacterized membrane protein YqaE (UPF0057 family)